MKRITTIALHSVFLVALVFSTGYTLAQKETQEKQQTEKKQVPTQSVPRPLPNKQKDRIVIAPVTISIPDESALINVLRPFSTPPKSILVFLEDGTGVMVGNLEWIENNQYEPQNRPSVCLCDNRRVIFCDWRGCGTRLCASKCHGDVTIISEPIRKLPPTNSAEVISILRSAGLQFSSGKRKKAYPIEIVLYDGGSQPEQTITCMAKDAQGNCTHWRICGTTVSGVYKCYDVVKDPLLGWVVTW
jgi:hypothetical protein